MGDNKRFAEMEVPCRAAGVSKKRRISASFDASLLHLDDRGCFVDSQDSVVSASNFENSSCFVSDDDSCSSFCSHQVLASSCFSSCSSDESGQVVKCTLANEGRETKHFESIVKSTLATNSEFRTSSETVHLCRDLNEEDSRARKHSTKNDRRSSQLAKMPPRIEIEAFFAEAEKYEQKRFVEKYNFDIVNDVALEGRYQWLPLNPQPKKT